MNILDRNRKIQIVGIKRQFKQMNKPYYLRGIYNTKNGRTIHGVDLLEDENLKKDFIQKFNINDETMYSIKDGEWLDLSRDEHYVRYLYALITPQIAVNRHVVNETMHLFYLNDPIEESEKEIAKQEESFNAMEVIMGMSEREYMDLALFVGINVRDQSTRIVKAALGKMAVENPEKINMYTKNGAPEKQVFVNKLIIFDILSVRTDGIFFRDQHIAISKEEAIGKIFSNDPLLQRLKVALDVVENPHTAKAEKERQKYVDDTTKKELEDKEKQIKISDLKLSYYKLTGTDYDGDLTVDALEAVIATISSRKEKVSEFETKFADATIDALKKSATARKIPEEEWLGVTDPEEMKKIIIKHIVK